MDERRGDQGCLNSNSGLRSAGGWIGKQAWLVIIDELHRLHGRERKTDNVAIVVEDSEHTL